MTNYASSPATHLIDHQGEEFQEVIARIHQILRPKSYLEIGTWTGNSLKHAYCPSIAIDPRFALTLDAVGNKTECHFFQMSSDEFFETRSPTALLGRTVDLAFLDGMHLFEYLLRDIINVEPYCSRNSIILLHDCLPTDVYITSRVNDPAERALVSTRPGWWAGDVWKILPILRKFRPDLVIVALDAPPTGLVLVTNLYPQSRTLRDRYQEIVAEFSRLELIDYGLAQLYAEAKPMSTRMFASVETFGPTFWL